MKTTHTSKFLLLTLLITPVLASAQSAPTYDSRVTFAPLTLPEPVNAYRSGSGAPGPQYWQNSADYVMHASIDTAAKTLTNDEVITYTNNSPDTLTSLWIHLEQNSYRKDSREHTLGTANVAPRVRPSSSPAAATPPASARAENFTEGFVFDLVETQILTLRPSATIKTDYLVSGHACMQPSLPTPLAPPAAVRIHMRYHYTIPGEWGGRTSWGAAQQGEIYDIAQWYPRMCVYDDLRGWDAAPVHRQ